ncbi:MAG: ATP-binding cassette domain-containing protein [Candidatus Omnitrophota bacterium]|jgi:putative ABC transport system ATP-binding protein|nr:MAG: ATP-binding cassette domain-containing protein [Candidatus Omnitrophota bacterium]
MNALIAFNEVHCSKETMQKQIEILNELTFSIESGEIVTILGPSGSGKSTILRVLIGLDAHDRGCILFREKNILAWEIVTLRREIGMVSQIPYLFAGTVRDNILYGPRIHKQPIDNETTFVHKMMEQAGLPLELESRNASDLSVGQKMRVSLARTLANNPHVLLLDEPTAALDPTAANQIVELIRKLNEQHKLTLLIVTHNVDVARRLGGRSLILMDGQIVEEGSIDNLLRTASSRTKDFLEGKLP